VCGVCVCLVGVCVRCVLSVWCLCGVSSVCVVYERSCYIFNYCFYLLLKVQESDDHDDVALYDESAQPDSTNVIDTDVAVKTTEDYQPELRVIRALPALGLVFVCVES